MTGFVGAPDRITWPLLLLAVSTTALASAAEHPAPMMLDTGWSYRWGDPAPTTETRGAWLDESPSSDWQSMPALAVPPRNGQGNVLWIRVPLPPGDWPDPALFAGPIAGAFEVYSRGKPVYARGDIRPDDHEDSVFSTWSLVPLPTEANSHPVFFRIQTSTGANPGIQRTLRIGSSGDLTRLIVRGGLPSFVVGMLALILALVAFAGAWRATGTRPVVLTMALFFLTSGVLVLSLSDLTPLVWDAPQLWRRLVLAGAAFLGPAMGTFIAAALGFGEAHWFRQLTAVSVAVAAIVSVIAVVSPPLVQQHTALLVVFIFGSLTADAVVAVGAALKGHPDARILVAGVVALLMPVAYDSLPSIGVSNGDGFHTYVGLALLDAALLATVIRRLVLLQQSLRDHSRQLEAGQRVVRDLSQKLSKGAHDLIDAVHRLRATSAQQNQSLTQQSVSAQQIHATASEIHQTSQLAAEKATTTMAATNNADDVSRAGASALEQSLNGLQAIQREVADMAQRVVSLGTRAREIGTIVETVKDLADQSNILALNAAIEATRAGEHGKGFAVVAREVRRLADQSIQSTVRIREILVGVSDGIGEAATSSERGETRVRESLEQVQASGDQLRKLSELIRETSNTVRQIAAAVSQQNAGIGQFFTAINELSQQMSDTLDRLGETEKATGVVEAVAQELAGLVIDQGQTVPSMPAMRAA